ncbi:MAG: type I DNA topoisomerase, partial [Gammaproteobacteria bacterium]|nr:type I DNA topoisomerase [Gammaproteobacteria bacterium]
MAKSLVIVESPAKARTINKYLGEDFEVLASYGHVRDLLSKDGAVDVEHDFAMHYELVEKNIKHVDEIIKAMKKADVLYLATDPDREGEAIAWHLFEILSHQDLLVNKDVRRIVFHEITERAIVKAIANPRKLSDEMIHAQQARRALDYLVGFNLSPLLWRKIRRGLSAGRVQSPALRMIVEREQEIEQFEPKEYWFIEADLNAHQQDFSARLFQYQDEKLQQFSVTDAEDAKRIEQLVDKAADGKLTVARIEKKQHKRNPAAPFITSTLQQEAARKLGFGAQRTMRAAQQLYEGIDVGDGETGLITYMRTDSVYLSEDAVQDIRKFISDKYGQKNLPDKPNTYKTKSKNAQEAHEAIRPANVGIEPDAIRKKLSADQYKIYELIWKRSISSQMIQAIINTVSLDLKAGDALFRTAGSVVVSPGFMSIYKEDGDDVKREDEDRLLPPLEEGDVVDLRKIRPEQHFTQPSPRYTEASLVKALEEHDIGRPSTYAAIIYTLQQRDYVEMERKCFIPTDIGRIVNRFLTEHFTDYIDYDYTAHLEDELDAIARGEKEWIPLMQKFWKPFKALIDEKAESVRRKDVTQELIEEQCPECGKQLAIRLGRLGR